MEDDPCSQSFTRYRLLQVRLSTVASDGYVLGEWGQGASVMSTIANDELRNEIALHWNWLEFVYANSSTR